MLLRTVLCAALLAGGCARAAEPNVVHPSFPLSARFSATGVYVSTTWLSEGRPVTEIRNTTTGKLIKSLGPTPIWGVFSDIAWYHEGNELRELWLGSGRRPSISAGVQHETRLLRADIDVTSLHLAADFAVYLRRNDTGPSAETQEIVACRFDAAQCVRSPPIPCAQFRNSTLSVRRDAAPVIGLRCKNRVMGTVQVDDYFWSTGGELKVFSSTDTDEAQRVGGVDGALTLVTRDLATGRLALKPIDGSAPQELLIDGPLGPSNLARSDYQAVGNRPFTATTADAWRLLATSGNERVVLVQRMSNGRPEMCFALVRSSGEQPSILSCRVAYAAETVTALDTSGRPLTAHFYTPAVASTGLVIHFHGGPFEPLPADAGAEVIAWLNAGLSVLDVGYVGGQGFSEGITPTAESTIPAMVEEARTLEASLRSALQSVPPTTFVSGRSFGGILALAFGRAVPQVRGVFLSSPLCSVSAQRASWASSPWMPTYRAPYGMLMDRGAGDLRDLSCSNLMSSGPPVFVSYSKNDPTIGTVGVEDIEIGLLANEGRVRSEASEAASHTAFTIEQLFVQIMAAKTWFESAKSQP